jgi:site-specific recombinase XerD
MAPMSTDNLPAISDGNKTELERAADAARQFAAQAKAPNTLRAYASDWRHFCAWCEAHRMVPMPAAPEAVAMYLADLAATHKAATLTRRVSAISQAHHLAGQESPTDSAAVRAVMAGIRRAKGTAAGAKAPALTGDVRAMVAAAAPGLLGVRDRALLLLGFAGAFRRSELTALDHEDLEFTIDGLVVTLRRSKTDQEAQGRKVGIPYGSNPQTCPVHAVQAWLAASGITKGAIFRHVDRHGKMHGRLSGYAVALVVKRHAEAAGLDAAKYAGHSLRAGLATSAAIGGASERAIMAQTGHRSVSMVRRYIRDGSLFRENAAAKAGL